MGKGEPISMYLGQLPKIVFFLCLRSFCFFCSGLVCVSTLLTIRAVVNDEWQNVGQLQQAKINSR